MTEIEVKILDIDREKVTARLHALGALKTFDDLIHALYYDMPDHALRNAGKMLRLRREGPKAVLAVKLERENAHAKERTEREVSVSDFDSMRLMLEELGYRPWLEMKKRRTSYRLGETHIELDVYDRPHDFIPPFIEIEGPDMDALYSCAERLGFSREDCLPWDASDLIRHYGRGREGRGVE